jgi:hypothetical protein
MINMHYNKQTSFSLVLYALSSNRADRPVGILDLNDKIRHIPVKNRSFQLHTYDEKAELKAKSWKFNDEYKFVN